MFCEYETVYRSWATIRYTSDPLCVRNIKQELFLKLIFLASKQKLKINRLLPTISNPNKFP